MKAMSVFLDLVEISDVRVAREYLATIWRLKVWLWSPSQNLQFAVKTLKFSCKNLCLRLGNVRGKGNIVGLEVKIICAHTIPVIR